MVLVASVLYIGAWGWSDRSLAGSGMRDALVDYLVREMKARQLRNAPRDSADPMFTELNHDVHWSIPVFPMLSVVRYDWSMPFQPGGKSRLGCSELSLVWVRGTGARVLYNHTISVAP